MRGAGIFRCRGTSEGAFGERGRLGTAQRDRRFRDVSGGLGARRAEERAIQGRPATAYRSAKNEKHLAENGLRSQIHRKKPQGKPMPEAVARANGKKSKVRAYVEHVFAQQKGTMVLVIRTIGLARATVKIGLANLTYNMKRAVWLSARTAAA